MTKDTAKKIALYNGDEKIQKWARNAARFVAAAHPMLLGEFRKACDSCPFRGNVSSGGCIGEECPVNAVWKAITLAPKRVSACTKELYKARYAIS